MGNEVRTHVIDAKSAWRLLFVTALLAGACCQPRRALAGASLVWGDLQAGPHTVGFRSIAERDLGRAAFSGTASEAHAGRAIRIYTWYPAEHDEGRKTIHFSRYAELMDDDFPPLPPTGSRLSEFKRSPLARSLSPARLEALLDANTRAVEDARPVSGTAPLIVLAQGLYYESPIAHAILCEYLASHGYVVATCPLVGDKSRKVNLDVIDLEVQVRDLEFVIAKARYLPGVSRDRLGLLGFDMGGMAGVILAMRNPEVGAFASLDSGILYGHPSNLPVASPHYDVEELTCPWLHLTRSEAMVDADARGSLFETAVHAERFLGLFDGLQHADFNSFALIDGREPVPAYWGPIASHSRASYETMCRYVLAFFDSFLRDSAEAKQLLTGAPATSANGVRLTIRHRSAQPVPMSPDDLVNVISAGTIDEALSSVRVLAQKCPQCEVARESFLNELGYKYLYYWGQMGTAVRIFQLNVELYPDSANTHDSLGEAYLSEGNVTKAVACYRKSLELNPNNRNAKSVLSRIDRQ